MAALHRSQLCSACAIRLNLLKVTPQYTSRAIWWTHPSATGSPRAGSTRTYTKYAGDAGPLVNGRKTDEKLKVSPEEKPTNSERHKVLKTKSASAYRPHFDLNNLDFDTGNSKDPHKNSGIRKELKTKPMSPKQNKPHSDLNLDLNKENPKDTHTILGKKNKLKSKPVLRYRPYFDLKNLDLDHLMEKYEKQQKGRKTDEKLKVSPEEKPTNSETHKVLKTKSASAYRPHFDLNNLDFDTGNPKDPHKNSGTRKELKTKPVSPNQNKPHSNLNNLDLDKDNLKDTHKISEKKNKLKTKPVLRYRPHFDYKNLDLDHLKEKYEKQQKRQETNEKRNGILKGPHKNSETNKKNEGTHEKATENLKPPHTNSETDKELKTKPSPHFNLYGFEKQNEQERAQERDEKPREDRKETENQQYQKEINRAVNGGALTKNILCNAKDETFVMTPEHLQEIRKLTKEWISKDKCSVEELQQLLRELFLAADTMRIGAKTLFPIIKLMKQQQCLRYKPHFDLNNLNLDYFNQQSEKQEKSQESYEEPTGNLPTNGDRFEISKEIKQDVRWWDTFLQGVDGICPDTVCYTDACPKGFGAFSNGKFMHGEFPEAIFRDENFNNISNLEALAVMVAFKMWAPLYPNKNFLVFSDSQETVSTVNSCKERGQFGYACVKEIFYIAAMYNCDVTMVYLPGSKNTISDCLSRWTPTHINKFNKLTEDYVLQEYIVSEKLFEFLYCQ